MIVATDAPPEHVLAAAIRCAVNYDEAVPLARTGNHWALWPGCAWPAGRPDDVWTVTPDGRCVKDHSQ